MGTQDYSIWLFQAHPDRYDLPAELQDMDVGDQEGWNVNQYRDAVGYGDVVLLWSASGGGQRRRGIYGVARINGDVFRRRSGLGAAEFAVPLRIERILDEPVLYEQLNSIEALAGLSILNYHQQTNFPVTGDEWDTLVEHFPQLAVDISPPPRRAALPPSRKRELGELLEECVESYDWQSHLDRFDAVRQEARKNFVTVVEADERGEDVTDLVLERLLPHMDSKHNRETGRWIHIAPSISRDIKDWYEGSGWTEPEDWPKVAEEILTFVRRCLDEPEDLPSACREFSASPLSTGFQTGTLTPILNALRPEIFSLINNKSRRALNYFALTNFSQKLRDYPEANKRYHRLAESAREILSGPPFEDRSPEDIFDMLSHWLKAEKDFDFTPPSENFWKVSPGSRAKIWPRCREGGYIAIGWDMLGDLSEMSHQEFQARRDELVAGDEDLTTSALNQVWRFSQMSEGDVVVANQGTSRVVGIGVVTGSYYFEDDADKYKHRMPIEWNDTNVHEVDQPGWRSTFIKLDRETFEEIQNAPIIGGDDSIPPTDLDDDIEAGSASDAPLQSTFLEDTRNVILFGPPGTGKTWSTNRRAVELCLRPDTRMEDDEIQREYRRLHREGRIEFLTFHQSFAYEEFVEGIRPVMVDDTNEERDEVAYRCEAGAFKKMALRAAAEGIELSERDHNFETLWQHLLEEVRATQEHDGLPYTIDNYKNQRYALTATSQNNLRARRVYDRSGGAELDDNSLGASKSYARALWKNREVIGDNPGDYTYKLVSGIIADEMGTGGGCHGHILWAVHFALLELAEELEPSSATRELKHQQRIEILKDILAQGPQEEITLSYEDVPEYVLVIDEINRGNISEILGELITLLEPSKRLTEPDELVVTLPYSKERFAVPPNLHIVATMNTADRSIALMDVALRRRFRFEPMLPNWNVLRDTLQTSIPNDVHGGKEDFINLVIAIFENINARIEFLYDADHRVGHTFFLDVKGYKTLQQVFLEEVIPLLQEYFYDAWDRLCLALGCPYDERGAPARDDSHGVSRNGYDSPVVSAIPLLDEDLLGMRHDEFRNQQRFIISEQFADRSLDVARLKPFFEGILSGDHLQRYEANYYTAESAS